MAKKKINKFVFESGIGKDTNLFPKAYALLTANKQFIQAQVVAFINAKIEDAIKCERDVEYIIDAAGYDIALGTNYNAIFQGIAETNAPDISQFVIDTIVRVKDNVLTLSEISGNSTALARATSYFDEILGILENGRTTASTLSVTNPTGASAGEISAKDRLIANKDFMAAEVVAYVETIKPSGYVYDSTVCSRDVKYTINSLIYDIIYGGNSATYDQAKFFFYGYASGAPGIAPEHRTTAVAGYTRLQEIVQQVVLGETVTVTTGNTLTQNTSGSNASSTEATTLSDLVQITSDVINCTTQEAALLYLDGITRTAPDVTWALSSLQNAKTAIDSNKETILTDSITYRNYTYESSKCVRDVGYQIDAVAHDLRYGGNVKMRQISDLFWINGRPQIRGDVSPEITAQQYIRDIINTYIFTNTLVDDGITQDVATQVRITGQNAEAGATTRVTDEFELLGNVVENGVGVMPAKVNGVSSIRVLTKYTTSDILLITDSKTGTILYNFADPANTIELEYKTGKSSGNGEPLSDIDFKSWWQTTDTITTIYLSADTSDIESADDVQIFVDDPDTQIRPWSFGTDAIERMRVAAPQAMLDADFEYGLQPTKWQQISLLRSYPSIYEIPGTDYTVTEIITDASTTTGSFGASQITVTVVGNHGLSIGDPITIKGLNTAISGYSRAEGSFLVTDVPSTSSIVYYSSARVGETSGQSLYTASIQMRKGAFYTGASIGQPTFSIADPGTSVDILTVFTTPSGSDRLAYESASIPNTGSQISGTGIHPGTSVSGNTGTSILTKNIAEDTTAGQTYIVIDNVSGVQVNMAVNNGAGISRIITSIDGYRLNLDDSYDLSVSGSNASYTNRSGTLQDSIGVGATFNVSYSGNVYTVTDPGDSASLGQNFQPGDQITIDGADVGGVSGDNDILVTIASVDSSGAITAFGYAGTAPDGLGDYAGVVGTVGNLGTGAIFTVSRNATSYSVTVTTTGSGYAVGNLIVVPGDQLGGTTPANDASIEITSVNGAGGVLTASVFGDVTSSTSVTIYPTLTVSELTIAEIPVGTTLNTGAVATIEVQFENNHGLIPGAALLSNISSNPAPVITYTPQTLPTNTTWYDVIWTGTNWIATKGGGSLFGSSTDGVTWDYSPSPNTNNWVSITQGEFSGENYLVTVTSSANQAAYSTDGGTTWNTSVLPSVTNNNWTNVKYAGGYFVAVRSGSNGAAYSIDGGVTWTTGTLPSASSWVSVAGGYIGSQLYFVAIATSGTAAAFSIDGGATWSASTLPSSSTWRDVAYGNGRFVAIANGTAAAYSTNGITWTSSTIPTSSNWETIEYSGTHFLVLSNNAGAALTTTTGETTNWKDETVNNGGWVEVAYGGPIDDRKFVAVGSTTNAVTIELTPSNHALASGPVIVSSVPSLDTIQYSARAIGTIDESVSALQGDIYVRPDTFFTHRPYDGGVQLGTGGPQHGAQAVRQSKKYIRYQSGKGIMYTTGALFAPSYNISSASADGYEVGSLITFVTDDTDHGLQAGGVVEVNGIESFEYNGTYTVHSVVDSKTFRVLSLATITDIEAILGQDAYVSVRSWHGATVRSGPFDDQNGIFFQYDGQRMAVGRRSSTLQLAGTVSVEADSNRVVGLGTRFQDQLKVGDRVVLKGMSHTVTSISSQNELTFNPDYRGATDANGAKICKTYDLLIPQEDWNLDTLDGNGPSGYNLDVTRMQMIGMQYSWYAAGFIEFMLRGSDGKFIIFHRMRNSNINTEAYMRTANLPVRYEVHNEGARSYLKASTTANDTSLSVSDASYFPTSGIVYVDNELIAYSGKSGDVLTNCTRSANLSNFAAGQNRIYTAGSATSHSVGAGVILVSCNITPVISHWGSALLTDGMFDEDRGYLFSYASTGVSISTSRQTAFLIRLAPSVSNALTGDLGDRELLNRAQLLLQEISITADAMTSGASGIVIEGVLNPQNYPSNPGNIVWSSLNSSGAGGQPSFAQIANGGSVTWGGAGVTTTTATVQGALSASFTAQPAILQGSTYYTFKKNVNYFYLTQTVGAASGIAVYDTISSGYFPSGTYVTGIFDETIGATNYKRYELSRASFYDTTSTQSITVIAYGTASSYTRTNYLFFTYSTWIASGASVGTRVDTTETKFPAGTSVNSVISRTFNGTTFYRVGFTQSSNTTVSSGNTIVFGFGELYALPGEQIFSFIANPGERSTLDLSQLKELTTTAIGGRGAFPNGPDVLAINVYKVSGSAVNANIILRWSEAQA